MRHAVTAGTTSFHGTNVFLKPTANDEAGDGITLGVGQATDDVWDDFLQRSERGQFQQSGMWGKAKSASGWQAQRILFWRESTLVGGFSLLWRNSKFGRIGYVNKGPVLLDENEDSAAFAVFALERISRTLTLRGLIVQAPDNSHVLDRILAQRGFSTDRFARIIDATLVLPLDGRLRAVEAGLHTSARRNLRKARARGPSVWIATESELPVFFELMSATCARRKTRPNPASVDELKSIWRAFSHRGSLRLALAQCGDTVVAGTLTVGFGRCATLWKTGWTGTHQDWHTNELLAFSEIQWALEQGYALCDFGAIDRTVAENILAGKPRSQFPIDGRYAFLLQFGGLPKVLPPARFFSTHRSFRWLHRIGHRCFRTFSFLSPSVLGV
jgi:lipid II:glycine glycyltransferase (peptidoglycan interpeptide bridge formation enzyme)